MANMAGRCVHQTSLPSRCSAHVPLHGLSVLRRHSAAKQQHLMGNPSSGQSQSRSRMGTVSRATIDDPELAELVLKMEAMRPPPPAEREKLINVITMIDKANGQDPSRVDWEGQSYPYHLLYAMWCTEWVEKLDPKASDELLILARGRTVESWTIKEIKRDDYPPNSGGERMWLGDQRRKQAELLISKMREAGYEGNSIKLVEDIMLDTNLPDPRDIRRHDLVGPLGQTNFTMLEEACMIQVLRDADAMVFIEKSSPQVFASPLSVEEKTKLLQRELSCISFKCAALVLAMPWSSVQRKLIYLALPTPRRFGRILKGMEGVASASNHPGDSRYVNFDYE